MKLTVNFMLVANTKEKNQTMQKHAVIMKNAVKKVVQGWIAVKTKSVAKKMVQQKWIAAKTANALKKVITERTAANKKSININFLNGLI